MTGKKIANKGEVLSLPTILIYYYIGTYLDLSPTGFGWSSSESLSSLALRNARKIQLYPMAGSLKAMHLPFFRWTPELPLPSILCNSHLLCPGQRFRHSAPKVKKAGHPGPGDFAIDTLTFATSWITLKISTLQHAARSLSSRCALHKTQNANSTLPSSYLNLLLKEFPIYYQKGFICVLYAFVVASPWLAAKSPPLCSIIPLISRTGGIKQDEKKSCVWITAV